MTAEMIKPATVGDLPILPAWLRDRATLTHAARLHTTRHARRVARWVVAAPRLVALLVLWSPRGCGRVVTTLAKWIYDQDSATLRRHHAGARETGDYARAHSIRTANLHARWLTAGVMAAVVATPALAWTAPGVLSAILGVLAGALVIKAIPGRGLGEVAAGAAVGLGVWWFGPGLLLLIPRPPLWPLVLAALLAVPALGWHGRPRHRPLVAATVDGPDVVPLRAPMVRTALCQLGIGALKDPESVRLLTDVHRHGPGVQVDVELPPGVPATAVMERREELAAALRRELGCVWPSVGARHPGHLALYVADQAMTAAKQAPWPLAKDGQVDLFAPQPMFTNQMGAWVNLTIAYSNGVIGAVPRMGKTFALRQLLLVAGLDPRARVYAIDGKGTGDLAPCGLFAHYVGVGDEPEDIEEQLDAMRGLRVEMRRRAKVIRDLPREECPESKVTSVLADRRDLGLEPVIVGVDETQVWFGYGEKSNRDHKAIREEFAAIVTDLVKRGPALGIWVFLATQQVNAETIPTAISNNAVIRLCLKVFGHTANDQILGTGARREGVDATMFAPADKGICYLRADGATPQIVRTVHGLDAVEAERVAARARAIREAAGRLTGQAAGQVAEPALEPDLVADVRDVMDHPARPAVHLVDLVNALALLRPGTWAHLDVEALGSMLRAAGVTVGQVKVGGRNTSGVRRDALDGASDGVGEDAAG